MEWIVDFLMGYGYVGMLIAAFIAGSFFPFSSEAVMVGLMAAGLDPWLLMIYGTIGNGLGSMFNYGVGRMGKLEWIEKYLHVKKKDLDRAERFMAGRGAWMGFFAFLPLIGTALAIILGLMRANFIITFISIFIHGIYIALHSMFCGNRCNQTGNQQLQMGINHVRYYISNCIHCFILNIQCWYACRIWINKVTGKLKLDGLNSKMMIRFF